METEFPNDDQRNSRLLVTSPRVKAQNIHCSVLDSVDQVIEVINEQERKNYKLGVFLLILAISTWLIGLELVNLVLKGDEYQKPFSLAVLTGSCYTLNLIPNIILVLFKCIQKPSEAQEEQSLLEATSPLETQDPAGQGRDSKREPLDDAELKGPGHLNAREVATLAFQLALIYFGYNLFVMQALKYTLASSQTILGSTTTFFTLIMGVFFKIDKFTYKKLFCVIASLCGVILITLGGIASPGGNEHDLKPKNPYYGNCFALVAAFLYALYLINMKLSCGTGMKTTNERELFGWVGCFTIFLGLPVLVVVHMLGIETFELPPTRTIFLMILINAVFSVISDYVTVIAMLLTSPLLTSLALTSAIPITLFVDFLILRATSTDGTTFASNFYVYTFGVACILSSVVLINLDISFQNDFIEEIIDSTLENAAKSDEVLSPVLMPYLNSSRPILLTSNTERVIKPFSPRTFMMKPRPSLQQSLSCQEVSRFTLSTDPTCEDEHPHKNLNHSKKLYNVGAPDHTKAGLLIYGGINHEFVLQNVTNPT